MNNKFSKVSEFFSGKGFYIAAAASVLVIALAVWVAYSSVADKLDSGLTPGGAEETTPQIANAEQTGVTREAETLPRTDETLKNAAAETKDTAKDVMAEGENEPSAAVNQPIIRPHSGEVVNAFSNGELVKSKTLNVWKTHDGVDIAGALGDHVKSMTGGTVTQIYEDPMWGVCAVIDHGNGLEGYYCSLNKVLTVSVGDTVSAGTVIGAIGDTADCELNEVSHLHFGLKKDGEWIDPLTVRS